MYDHDSLELVSENVLGSKVDFFVAAEEVLDDLVVVEVDPLFHYHAHF